MKAEIDDLVRVKATGKAGIIRRFGNDRFNSIYVEYCDENICFWHLPSELYLLVASCDWIDEHDGNIEYRDNRAIHHGEDCNCGGYYREEIKP